MGKRIHFTLLPVIDESGSGSNPTVLARSEGLLLAMSSMMKVGGIHSLHSLQVPFRTWFSATTVLVSVRYPALIVIDMIEVLYHERNTKQQLFCKL